MSSLSGPWPSIRARSLAQKKRKAAGLPVGLSSFGALAPATVLLSRAGPSLRSLGGWGESKLRTAFDLDVRLEVASRFERFGRCFGGEVGVRPPAGLVTTYLQGACRGSTWSLVS